MKKSWIIKAAKKELEKDNQLIAELVVAEKLGKTLVELREQITADELMLWIMFYEIRADQEKKQLEQAKKRRR